ncbi:cold shock domain-containing protein [Photobacterium leiognathi]|uniref:cold-shock protein n=1 Tax=Photobacterium leiognathi TaxID=553611 RepID=UPI001EDE701B|nr:cold shock domain-containing protein [Photobacterium leiognathi]MCG3884490.1 cold shock domain-containing protein [Photobacterium leiognathi]
MNGTIQSYSNAHNYGFIIGEDGNSYFLHKSEINDIHANHIVKGAMVKFTPASNPKGLVAKNPIFETCSTIKIKTRFFTSRNPTPLHGKVECRQFVKTTYFHDFNLCRSYFYEMAYSMGATAILGIKTEAKTIEGQQMFSYEGDFAIVTEIKAINDNSASPELDIRSDCERFESLALKAFNFEQNLLKENRYFGSINSLDFNKKDKAETHAPESSKNSTSKTKWNTRTLSAAICAIIITTANILISY